MNGESPQRHVCTVTYEMDASNDLLNYVLWRLDGPMRRIISTVEVVSIAVDEQRRAFVVTCQVDALESYDPERQVGWLVQFVRAVSDNLVSESFLAERVLSVCTVMVDAGGSEVYRCEQDGLRP